MTLPHPLPTPEDDYDAALLEDIRREGWTLIQIEPEDEEGLEWSHTLGLWRAFQHPEIVLIGLEAEVAEPILSEICAAVAEGERIETGRPYADFATASLRFVNADRSWLELFLEDAVWLYDGDEFPVLQCVWPLASGAYPGEAGFDAAAAKIQPSLERPDPAAAADIAS